MKQKKLAWDALLTSETELELKQVGRMVTEAREKRGFSVSELANRVGIDRRTLTQLEDGSPKVSLGIFFQTLSALNLLQGIEQILLPENDIETIGMKLRKIRKRKPLSGTISSAKVRF